MQSELRAEQAEVAEASARFEWGTWEHRAHEFEARVAELTSLIDAALTWLPDQPKEAKRNLLKSREKEEG